MYRKFFFWKLWIFKIKFSIFVNTHISLSDLWSMRTIPQMKCMFFNLSLLSLTHSETNNTMILSFQLHNLITLVRVGYFSSFSYQLISPPHIYALSIKWWVKIMGKKRLITIYISFIFASLISYLSKCPFPG